VEAVATPLSEADLEAPAAASTTPETLDDLIVQELPVKSRCAIFDLEDAA
jgi:hypothetical protein